MALTASEIIKSRDQGRGKPIVSNIGEDALRNVWVGGKLYHGKWPTFKDFLRDYLKEKMGVDWAKKERAKSTPHRLYLWNSQINIIANGNGGYTRGHSKVRAYMQLAYALYLIEHNDVLSEKLLNRLRSDVDFIPAFYETIVCSYYVVSGYRLTMVLPHKSSDSQPELLASYRDNISVYSVEAKCKIGWPQNLHDPNDENFKIKLRLYVSKKLKDIFNKKLANTHAWIELNINSIDTAAKWRSVTGQLSEIFISMENYRTKDGTEPPPCPVFVTCHTYLNPTSDLDSPVFGILLGYKMPLLNVVGESSIEEYLESLESNEHVHELEENIGSFYNIPSSFNGVPPELLMPDGSVVETLQIGSEVSFTDDKNKLVTGVVTTATMVEEKVVFAIAKDGSSSLYEKVASGRELLAHGRFGDNIFGQQARLPEENKLNDARSVYAFLKNCYTKSPKDELDRIISEAGFAPVPDGTSQKDTAIYLCRLYARSILSMQSHDERVLK